MSQFYAKSQFNFEAAALLMRSQNPLYAPSIHCSYYSCVQYMLHIIYTKLPAQIKADYIHKITEDGGSSHKHAINIIEKELFCKQREDYKSFQRSITELKKSRVESDYKDIVIIQETGQRALNLAQSIRNTLAIHFR